MERGMSKKSVAFLHEKAILILNPIILKERKSKKTEEKYEPHLILVKPKTKSKRSIAYILFELDSGFNVNYVNWPSKAN